MPPPPGPALVPKGRPARPDTGPPPQPLTSVPNHPAKPQRPPFCSAIRRTIRPKQSYSGWLAALALAPCAACSPLARSPNTRTFWHSARFSACAGRIFAPDSRDAGIEWVDDPTNDPTSSWRAKDGSLLRRTALRSHALRVLGGGFGAPSSSQISDVPQNFFRPTTKPSPPGPPTNVSGWVVEPEIKPLRELPRAVRTRVLRELALEAGARGGELVGWHIDHLDELVTGPGGGRGIDLPGIQRSNGEGGSPSRG